MWREITLIELSHGVKAPLMKLLETGNDDQKEAAARLLWNLAMNDCNQVEIVGHGAIAPLVKLVKSGNDGQKEAAAGALQNLATRR
ncbi:unnamed protein product [Phytophthora lilii]|uniref:Vacuolar protein 8 n=1 Tax=Phytophthora lilii TaxID=2077276 RepID=A0A9W6WLG5_9STRA|nr:unnamed protein product [Phytophthora lilii]